MRNTMSTRVWAVVILTAVFFGWAAPYALAADELNKVGPATVTATQYDTKDKEVGKAPELTDGNAKTRWLCRTADVPLRVVFDMGVARTVGKVRIANYFTGQNFERGFKVVDIFVGDGPAPAKDGTPAAADVEVKISDKDGPAWTDIALAKQVKGRYVTVRVKSNWGGNGYAANEVELYTVEADAPAPEKDKGK